MAKIEIKVPDIGDFKDVEVIEVLVKAGDAVAKEQSLITVESDKASMEIPSSHAGTVAEMKLKIGDKVSEGSVVLLLESEGAAAAPAPKTVAAPAPAPKPAAAPAPSPAPASAAAAGGPLEVKVPDIGDFKEVEVIEVLVKPGDRVTREQSLITVESDKASMEIPSPADGIVQSLRVSLGDKVSEGSPILVLAAAGGTGAAATAPADAFVPAAGPPPTKSTDFATEMAERPVVAVEDSGVKPHASPSVRKFARELGVDLALVRGSGPKGRITADDVRGFVKGVLAGGMRSAAAPTAAAAAGAGLGVLPWPVVDFARFGPIERVEMSRIKKLSGPNLHRNWVMIPHVTNHEDADITDLEAFRVQLNAENAKNKDAPKLTMLAFLIKACVAALKKFPDLDKKGIFDIAAETAALAAKARDGKLSPADMQGGTFSISSLGGIGGTYFTPIINAPEVAILGVCRSTTKPVWDGKSFAPRLILPLSLSWDHRVVDGASAARFNAYLASLLADFRRAML